MLTYDLSEAETPWAYAVLLHPHPDMGGDRHNNVVSALYEALPPEGVTALRFDFTLGQGPAPHTSLCDWAARDLSGARALTFRVRGDRRFRFDVQFLQAFSGNDTTFTHLGPKRVPPFGSDTLGTNTDLRMQRRFATAGELLVGFANSTVWQFAGPDTYTTLSILNFSLVQPLLRAGGRDAAA